MEKMADVLIVGPKERTEMVNSVNVRFFCVTDDDWKASNIHSFIDTDLHYKTMQK